MWIVIFALTLVVSISAGAVAVLMQVDEPHEQSKV
jgi:hypothetical protein